MKIIFAISTGILVMISLNHPCFWGATVISGFGTLDIIINS